MAKTELFAFRLTALDRQLLRSAALRRSVPESSLARRAVVREVRRILKRAQKHEPRGTP